MKNKLLTTVLLLFSATVISYAGFFTKESINHSSNDNEISNNESVGSAEEIDSGSKGGFFKKEESGPDDPGDRPGIGGGIGQVTPVGEGLQILLACSVVHLITKKIHHKYNNKLTSG